MRDARTQGANLKNANTTGADMGSAAGPGPGKRYFGKGDVLRNAHLEFDSGASVEIESLFEQCTIALGKGTELVVGKSGVLSGCQFRGPGLITVHGKFVERESAGHQRRDAAHRRRRAAPSPGQWSSRRSTRDSPSSRGACSG